MKRKITKNSRIQMALFLKTQITDIIYGPPINSETELTESLFKEILFKKRIDNKFFLEKDKEGPFEVNGIKYKKAKTPTSILGLSCILDMKDGNKETFGIYGLLGNEFGNIKNEKPQIIYEMSEFPSFTKQDDTSLELFHVIKC